MIDRADLEKANFRRKVAKSRGLTTLVYLLELATIELAKSGDVASRLASEPKLHGPFGRRP
jgi:hypothetical protein